MHTRPKLIQQLTVNQQREKLGALSDFLALRIPFPFKFEENFPFSEDAHTQVRIASRFACGSIYNEDEWVV